MTDEKNNKPRSQSSMNSFPEPKQFREQAEQLAKDTPLPDLGTMRHEEIQQQFHELRVKQIEAELQNEQLRTAVGERDYRAELLTTITENMLDMIVLTDIEGKIKFSGKSVETIGYEPDSLLGKNAMDFVHPEDLPHVSGAYSKLVASGNPRRIEYRCRGKDGSYLWLETRAAIVKRKNTNAQEIVFSSRDISARKQAEEAFRESENKFYLLTEEAPVSIMHFDKNGIVKFVNKWHIDVFAKGMLGRDFFINKKITDLPGIQSAGIAPELEKILEGETVMLDQVHIPKFAVGHEGYQCMRGVPLFYNGEIAGGILIREDITERKQAEENLCYQKQLLETIINGTWDVLAIQYPDHTVERYNQAGYDLLGLPPNKVNGRKCFELIGRDRQCSPCATQQVLQCKEPVNIEKYVPELGAHLDCRSSPVMDENGDIIRIVEHLRDITKQKQAEEEKERLKDQAKKIEKMEALGRMAGAVAHHFNNQLNVVSGNLELVFEDISSESGVRGNLREAFEAANRGSHISRQILAYLGQGQSKREVFDLSEFCEQQMSVLQTLTAGGIHMNLDVEQPYPIIYASKSEVKQALTGLIVNSYEAMNSFSGKITVRTGIVKSSELQNYHLFPVEWRIAEDNYAFMEVSDTGSGIRDEEINNIFDPFYSTKFKGRGLGLSVVLGMARATGGGVGVASEAGYGTSVCIFFPLAGESEQPSNTEDTKKNNESKTILVIEAQEELFKLLKNILQHIGGYTAIIAESGEKAIAELKNKGRVFDCVITDLSLPGMDGFETLAAIKEIVPELPVILTSGYNEEQVLNGRKPIFPDAYIQKPYRIKELKAAIERVLG